MDEIEVYNQLSAIATPTFAVTFGDDSDQAIRIAEHKAWLGSIRRERPGTTPTRVHQRLSQNNLRKRQISCEITAELSK